MNFLSQARRCASACSGHVSHHISSGRNTGHFQHSSPVFRNDVATKLQQALGSFRTFATGRGEKKFARSRKTVTSPQGRSRPKTPRPSAGKLPLSNTLPTEHVAARKSLKSVQVEAKILDYIAKHELGYRKGLRRTTARFNSRRIGRWTTKIPDFGEGQRNHEVFFARRVRKLIGAREAAEFPSPRLNIPEVAFAGRSNVGKSSLLQALCIRQPDVQIADRPGTTTTIDFFQMGSKMYEDGSLIERKGGLGGVVGGLRLVDLPGYGFAYASEADLSRWATLNLTYLQGRNPFLKRVFVLVDARQGLKTLDFELLDKLTESKVTFQIVMTKTDLVPPVELAQRTMQVKAHLGGYKHAVRSLLLVSSITKGGIAEMWKELATFTEIEPVANVHKQKIEIGKDAWVKKKATLQKKKYNRARADKQAPTPKPWKKADRSYT